MAWKHYGPPRLEMDRTGLVLRFEYNKDWLPELRSFARWDGKVWRAPVDSLDAALAFCRPRGFKVSQEVDFFQAPPQVAYEGLEFHRPWIHLRFRYERVRAERAKRITGCTFDERLGVWTAPEAALDECIAFATEHRLPMDENLHRQALLVGKRREALIRGSMALDFPFVEGMHPALDPHQRAAVAYVNLTRRCFIADDIGVGKTFEAIAALEFCNSETPSYPALIVAPPKLIRNWEKEFALWYPDRTVQVVTTGKAPLDDVDVTVVGWSILNTRKEELAHRGYRAFVGDEMHSMKNRSAQRSRAMIHVAKNLAPNAIRLGLTGTPMTVRVEDFKPQLEALGMLEAMGGAAGFDRSFVREDNGEVLNRWLRGTGYIRRLRTDVLNLPPVVHGDITVEGSLTRYKAAERDVIAFVAEQAARIAAEIGEDPHSAAVAARLRARAGQFLVEMSVLRKEAAIAKVPAALEWLESAVESGKKVIVGAHHREVVDALSEPYGLKIQGGMSARQVEEVKREFQDGSAPVIVLSIQAGKEGHTLTAATDCLMHEFPWTSTDYDQTWGRGWRKGQTKPFYVTAMLLAGTKDEAQFAALDRRRRRVGTATHGDPGAAVLMSLFAQVK